MKKLELIITELNDYPIHQNARPLWIIASDKQSVLYYSQYSDRYEERSLSIKDALSCKSAEDLQKKMGV